MRTIWRLSLLVVLLAPVDHLFAVHPTFVTTASADEFLKGEFDGVSLSSDGKLLPAPSLSQIFDTGQAFIHSAAVGAGGTVYIGTGANGKVFRLDAAGRGSEFATLDEPAVYAIATDSKGRVYAGTSPDGKVYRLSADGKPEAFFDPDVKFIWDLLFDDQDNLYVATGPQGVIYKVSPTGEGKPFFDSDETHIVKLAWDLDKNLLAGSAPEGLLFRIDSSGKGFVVYDSSLEEMKGLAVDRYGNIYAAALSGGTDMKSAAAAAAAKKTEEKSSDESKVELPDTAKGAKLEVYRIDRQNLVDKLYASDDELAFDLAVRSDGSVLLGTGNKGRVLMLTRQGFVTLLVDTKEEQVTRLIEQNGSLLLMTSNLGKVYRVSNDAAQTGTFESDVIDAGMVSHWGIIRWRVVDPSPSQSVKLYTRSGNTKTPDGTWSEWSAGYDKADGSAITSDPARLLQWKVEFTAAGRTEPLGSQNGAVDLVSVSYQQSNMAPKVTSLTLLAPGVALAKVPGNPSGGVTPGGPEGAHAEALPAAIRDLEAPRIKPPSRRIYVPGARSMTWDASDPNGDTLVYSVFFRRQGESAWTLLDADVDDEEYTLDGASFPDGVYYLRVVASDRRSNPPNQALDGDLVSKPFILANSIPAIAWQPAQAEGTKIGIKFSASTTVSPIYQTEYSLDGVHWFVVFPVDGISDSTAEQYSFELTNPSPQSRNIFVRVVDSVGNLGTSAQALPGR